MRIESASWVKFAFVIAATALGAQAQTREYIRLNGRIVAVENNSNSPGKTVSDWTFTSGETTYNHPSSITVSATTVSNSASVTLTVDSGGAIHLLPEFRATAGSASITFRAKVNP